MTSNHIQDISTDQLRPHPINSKIYKVENIEDLANDINKSQWIKPLTVTPNGAGYIIVSGHRRHAAAQYLELDVLPCEVVDFKEDWQVMERLLLENQYREKDTATKARELPHQKEVESARARLRQMSGLVQNTVPENFPERDKGDSRDKAAKKVGFGSGKTAEAAAKVVQKSDELREQGDHVKADLLIAAVNKSVSGAAKLVDVVEDIDIEQAIIFEDSIARGEMSVSGAYKQHKQESGQKARFKNEQDSKSLTVKPLDCQSLNVHRHDENIYAKGVSYNSSRFDDHIIKDGEGTGTMTTHSRFYHAETMVEYSMREYGNVQTFPNDYKFVGTYASIKKQIGNAVAPKMAAHVTKDLKGITIGDLFAGCGGFSCGAQMNGKKPIWAVEWEELPAMAYKLNHPNADVYQTNIKTMDPAQLPKVDIILGGPPCQGFSLAGLRFKDDPRNQLYKEFLRFVDVLRPTEFVMENVPQIQAIAPQIIEDFGLIGYTVKTILVTGSEIGMRQNRKRFFFIGQNQQP